MRVACTIGQDAKGKWHAIALPDLDPKQQKELLKDLHAKGGIVGSGKSAIKLVNGIVLGHRIKRMRFSGGPEEVA